MPNLTVEERLKRLEEIAFEGDDLNQNVKGLGNSVIYLGTALSTVYQNQQDILDIKDNVEALQTAAVTPDQVSTTVDHVKHSVLQDRKRTTRAVVLVIVFLAFLTLGFLSYTQTQTFTGCNKRNDSITVQQNITRNLTSVLPPGTQIDKREVDRAIMQLEQTKLDCAKITPLRWRL